MISPFIPIFSTILLALEMPIASAVRYNLKLHVNNIAHVQPARDSIAVLTYSERTPTDRKVTPARFIRVGAGKPTYSTSYQFEIHESPGRSLWACLGVFAEPADN